MNNKHTTSTIKDIIFTYTQLANKNKYFKHIYNRNPYKWVFIFGDNILPGDYDPYDFIGNRKSTTASSSLAFGQFNQTSYLMNNSPESMYYSISNMVELLTEGAGIKLLCQISQTMLSALDKEEDPVVWVREKHSRELTALMEGKFDETYYLKSCIEAAFVDSISFCHHLALVYSNTVDKYIADLADTESQNTNKRNAVAAYC